MKHFYNALNFCLILFVALLFILFQSTVLHQCFGLYKPNLILIMIAYLALNRFAMEGAVLAYVLGALIELNSGAPAGLYPAALVLTFVAAKIISEMLFMNTMLSQMFFVIAVSVLSKFFLLLILSLYESWDGMSALFEQTLIALFPMVVLNFLLTPIVFFMLRFLDGLLGKMAPSKTTSKEPSVALQS